MKIFRKLFKHPIHGFVVSLLPRRIRAHGTSNSTTRPDMQVQYRLVYRFRDAPVPPEFHRSYTIVVTPRKVRVSIDVYGKKLARHSAAITADRYRVFVAALLQLHITKCDEKKSLGCSGGKTDLLDIDMGENYRVKGFVYHCCGFDYGDLNGDASAAAELFKALIPDLITKVNSAG